MLGWGPPPHQSWMHVPGGCQREQDGGLAPLAACMDLHAWSLCCREEKGHTRGNCTPGALRAGTVLGAAKLLEPPRDKLRGVPGTLTPESPACASARCVARTGSGTGSRQTRRLCQRRQGGNRSGCRREPEWEKKTPLWAGQPHSPATAPLDTEWDLFSRLKRSGPEKE